MSENDTENSVENSAENNSDENIQIGFFQMVGSILSSFFGVRASKHSERDFKYGKARQFIAVGVLMTVVWYVSIYLIVSLVMNLTD
jgi:uncharacterized membrane protein